jgi:hypothetical protein
MMASSIPLTEDIAPIACGFGIPSITLLGTQKDWELLLLKLNRLAESGDQPLQYSQNLRPILSRFIATFQDPNKHAIRQFWNDMVTLNRGQCATTSTVSGWINGFHYWDHLGNPLVAAFLTRKV